MLSADVDRYVGLRRALGYKLARTERHLRAFARRHDERGDAHICSTILMDWVAGACGSFARFLHAEDPRHEVPLPNIFGSPKTRPTPYIYTDNEIARILDAAGALRERRPNPLRRELYVTLFA